MSCPFCGEDIAADAKKCRYCGEWIDPDAKPGASAPEREHDLPPRDREPEEYQAYSGPGASKGRPGRLFKKEPWQLRPDEQIVARSEPYLARFLVMWLVLGIPTIGVGWIIAATFWIYYRFMRFEWILTDRRLITVSGWLTRVAQNVSLDKINELNYRRIFMERVIYGTGTLFVETAATAGVTTLKWMAEDDPFRHALEREVERRRMRTTHMTA